MSKHKVTLQLHGHQKINIFKPVDISEIQLILKVYDLLLDEYKIPITKLEITKID